MRVAGGVSPRYGVALRDRELRRRARDRLHVDDVVGVVRNPVDDAFGMKSLIDSYWFSMSQRRLYPFTTLEIASGSTWSRFVTNTAHFPSASSLVFGAYRSSAL